MGTFAEKPNFSLLQVIAAITVALALGAGVARYEYNSRSTQKQLTEISDLLKSRVEYVDKKFLIVESRLSEVEQKLLAVTTSVTAFLRPEDVTLRRRK